MTRDEIMAVMACAMEEIRRYRESLGLKPSSITVPDLREARAAVAELLKARDAMAPLARAVVAARTEAEETAAVKALAKWLNDDLDAALHGDA